ncbi:MAG: hypothetical protein K0Q81_2104 [Paenibacillus sp.]|nr:hypothetical protein [Paenibacillus sp.]
MEECAYAVYHFIELLSISCQLGRLRCGYDLWTAKNSNSISIDHDHFGMFWTYFLGGHANRRVRFKIPFPSRRNRGRGFDPNRGRDMGAYPNIQEQIGQRKS